MALHFDSATWSVTPVTTFAAPLMSCSSVSKSSEEDYVSGTFRDLEVWKAAMEFALRVYRLTAQFPKEERYGLTSQMRRASVSIPSNIAEGKGRSSDKELIQFLCHSRGSLFEIETQLAIAEQLGYSTTEDCDAVQREAARIGQMLNGLIRSMRPSTVA
jgi:four helix bundle protein